ncbi:MAG: outer membrane protein transport protein [Acidobacteriota bacterium]|nr:outer membrane protein transport protein [Acidobacteriota bacterium]
MKIRLRVLLLLLLLALPVLVFSRYKPWYNYYNFAHGVKALSMGNAFTAVADDLTASFWNPAGLANLRTPEFYLGYKASWQWHDYDLQDNALAAEEYRFYNFNFASKLNQIDFFAISAPFSALQRPCTFALSYYRYIPYGFKGKAREVVPSLYDWFDPLETTVTFTGSEGFDVLAFSLAAAATDYFSVGATMQQFFGSGALSFVRVERVGDVTTGEYFSQLTEKIYGRNVILGALFSPFDWLRLGASWHSGLQSRLDSVLLDWGVDDNGAKINKEETTSQARVVIPEQFSLGLLLRPAAWLDVSADYSRIEWENGSIEDYYGSSVLPYPQKDAWSTGQKQVRNLRFGAEARIPFRSWKLSVRGGWSLDRQLYAAYVDKVVQVHGYSCGIGSEFSRNLLLEITFQRQHANWLENGYFPVSPDVNTHFRANVFMLALTYRFGHIFKE